MSFKKISCVIVIVLAVMMSLLSCSGDDMIPSFSVLNGSVSADGKVHTLRVGSAVESIDLNNYVQTNEEAEWKLFDSEAMETELENTSVTLKSGENIFYVRVEFSGSEVDFTVKIIRKNTVTVTFDTAGGTACKPLTVDEGTVITFPDTVKVGYELLGWNYDITKPVTENVTVTASWTPKKYKITLKADGTNIDNQVVDVAFDSQYSISIPSKPGYKFVKWTNGEADFASEGVWKSENDVELVAQFAKETYKVSYVYNTNMENKTISYTIDDEITLDIPVHPNGLEFLGWYSDAQLTKKVEKISKGSTGDIVLYASWKPEEKIYKITIDADGMAIDGEEISVKIGETYTLPSVTKEGYDFVAWMNGSSVIQTSGVWNIHEDITVTVKWNPIQYKYVYVYNTTIENKTQTFTVEDEVELEIPVHPEGFEFLGWYLDDKFTQKIEKIEKGTIGNKTLYASWKEEILPGEVEYEITVEADGLDCDGQEISVKYGEAYALPAISDRAGYEFAWILNGEEISSNGIWKLEDNATVVLTWTTITYDIKYVFNADIEAKTDSYDIEEEFVLEAPVHPEGLEFLGWYSDSQLTQKVEKIEKGTTGDKTFYASWKEKEPVYEVKIEADGFDCDGQILNLKYGDSYTLPVVDKKGYEFVAWKSGDIVIPTSGFWTIPNGATLTVEWKIINYSIEYVLDDKATNPNTHFEYTVESDKITLIPAERPGATFVGWYLDSSFSKAITEIPTATTGNITLYAKFEIAKYTLNYNPNGGSVSQEKVEYEVGETITLLVPQKPGYKFNGWYDGDNKFEATTWTFDKDVSVTAKWTLIDYLITYELNGGSTTETRKVYYTVEDTIVLPKPTKANYYFLGWSEGETTKNYQDMVITQGTTGNKKFVANWTYFSYSYSDGNATVTGYLFSNDRNTVKIEPTINYNGVDYVVTEIGENVFSGMGKRITSIIVGDSRATNFTVVVPNTLKTIKSNAFLNCNDVIVRALVDIEVDLNAWADALTIVGETDGNKHVRDVIKGERPAIGWSVYG